MDSSPIQLVENLNSHFDSIRPSLASSHSKKSVFVHPALKDCSHISIRNDTVRKRLQAPYDGPFRILHRTDKTFDVDINGRKSTISIDRVKPAFLERYLEHPPVVTETVRSDKPCIPVTRETKTRYGRTVRFTEKYGEGNTLRGECAVHAILACTSNLAECGNPVPVYINSFARRLLVTFITPQTKNSLQCPLSSRYGAEESA
ncbi:pol polyprotein [Trichonephila inaurata madagascariensis]|uniref:Pol polyprotein n=1 Tax=Trichonephila inaurata madagascariensis TaxID=2747483 RepID=A0A8X6IXE0_9ARAC|nr:pol polyprotein [Trichonephila inaurata madagascariensis]